MNTSKLKRQIHVKLEVHLGAKSCLLVVTPRQRAYKKIIIIHYANGVTKDVNCHYW